VRSAMISPAMVVADVMSRDVVTVTAETSLKDVAALLDRRRISGIPVCDADRRVLGIVSEADILRKEQGSNPDRAGLLWLLEGDTSSRAEVSARTAGEAMTAPAITIEPQRPVSEAARVMTERRVNRLPVVSKDGLIGIVTRADLVRVFHRSDEELSREIADDVLRETLWVAPEDLTISIEQGVVHLAGQVENRTTAALIVAFVRRVPGVVDVESELTWRIDDLSRRTASARPPRQA
jgi:CBS domain-containing protein